VTGVGGGVVGAPESPVGGAAPLAGGAPGPVVPLVVGVVPAGPAGALVAGAPPSAEGVRGGDVGGVDDGVDEVVAGRDASPAPGVRGDDVVGVEGEDVIGDVGRSLRPLRSPVLRSGVRDPGVDVAGVLDAPDGAPRSVEPDAAGSGGVVARPPGGKNAR